MAHEIVNRRSFASIVFGTRVWTMARALLAASVVVSAPSAAFFSGVLRITGSSTAFPSTFLAMWGACATIAVAISYTFGLAWHVLALRHKWLDGFSYLLAGVVLGVAFGVVGLIGAMLPLIESGRALPLGIMLGAAAFCWLASFLIGSTLWFAWFLRRPDRDATRSDVAGEFD